MDPRPAVPSLLDAAALAAARFADTPVTGVEPLGCGLINDTFLVSTAISRFVLQRLNRRVFPDPDAVMANLRVLARHVRGLPTAADDRLRLPDILPTRAGDDGYRDGEGGFWRALSYIDQTRTLCALADAGQAAQVGRALGQFHVLAGGIEPRLLRDTLPGFHIAPGYLARLDALAARPRCLPDPPELRAALDFVAARRDFVPVLERAKHQGRLRLRVIHGDPKLDNVLFEAQGGRAVGLIDLDTVKPGLIHYDIGDCLRSCCNRGGENSGGTGFDLEFCRAILGGYLAEARDFLTGDDRAHLYDAIRLLPLELGVRFLADHLAGDVYFKVEAPGQNLNRALGQFRLAESVERQEDRLRALIAELGRTARAPI